MPTFDATGLNHILAGDIPAAQDYLTGDHPSAFVQTVGAAVERAISSGLATSTSSESIGLGTKTFTLVDARDWKIGQPVYIVEDGDPINNYMIGKLAADEASGVITVTVTVRSGTGTFTAWTIFSLLAFTTVASPPLAIVDGGTGATTEAGARANFGLVEVIPVNGILSTPPGSPSLNDAWLVGDAPTGAWASDENTINTWDGAAWVNTVPALGDVVIGALISGLNGNHLAYKALTTGTLGSDGVWPGSQWAFFNLAPPRRLEIYQPAGAGAARSAISVSTTLSPQDADKLILLDLSGSSITVTLPLVAANDTTKTAPGSVYRFGVVATGSGVVTINVTGSGKINGSLTYVVPNALGVKEIWAIDPYGSDTNHYYVG